MAIIKWYVENMKYSRFNTNINKEMSSLQYLAVVFCFLSLTELTRFLLSFVLWSFQVLGEFFWWIMEQGVEEPKLGDAHGPPR